MTTSSPDDASVLNLLAAQIDIPKIVDRQQRNDHVYRTVGQIRSALSRQSADIVVLPELATVDYSRDSFARLDSLAETLDGESVEAFAQLAQEMGVMIVFGMPTQREQAYFISQVIVGADGGVVDCFDKLHTAHYGASMEKDYFSRGERLVVFSCRGFRLAPIICYDIRFPELTRTLTLDHEIDVLLHCGAYYRDESFASWHSFIVARAMENQIYVLSLNRAGEHYGNSVAAPPWVDGHLGDSSSGSNSKGAHSLTHFDAHAECMRWVRIEREVIDTVRRDYTFLADRRESYDQELDRYCV